MMYTAPCDAHYHTLGQSRETECSHDVSIRVTTTDLVAIYNISVNRPAIEFKSEKYVAS